MRGAITISVLLIGMLVVAVSGASAASQFSAAADPTTPGTPSAPQPTDLTLDYRANTDATGTPVAAVQKVTQLLPSEFVAQLAQYGTCPRATIRAVADGGPHGPPQCPANSVVGSGAFETVVPSVRLDASSDKMVIYNTGDGGLTAWFHVSKPAAFTGYEDGEISQGTTPFGPVVTWDFSRDANGGTVSGIEARLKHWQTRYARSSTDGGDAPAPASTPKRKKKLSCRQRARRIKNAGRRRAALKRCAKRRRHARHRARRTTARAAAQTQHAPFASTGCASGQWPFELQVAFKGGGSEKLDASVTCNATGPGGAPPPPACSLPPPLPCPIAAGYGSVRLIDELATV